MTMKRCSALLTFFFALTVVTTAISATSSSTDKPSSSWKLVFTRDKAVWTANGDGGGQKLVVNNAFAPHWSPDKTRIAFVRDSNVWVASADGSNQKQLTRYSVLKDADYSDMTITWSKRTGWITFSRPFKGETDIIDVNPLSKGKAETSVRFDSSDTGSHFSFNNNDNPAWSADGKLLAFSRNGDIWMAEFVPAEPEGRDGWDISRLSAVAGYDSPTWRASRQNTGATHMSWSPDGKYLAYTLNRLGGSGTAELHLITIGEQKYWTHDVAADRLILDDSKMDPYDPCTALGAWWPEFSPDGRWIAFSTGNNTYCATIDGKRMIKLLSDANQMDW